MPPNLLISGGRILDPGQGIDKVADLLISKGKIAWIGDKGTAPNHPDLKTIDARNLVVCPGFVDLHCHLREPGFEDKETISTGTKAAARGGFPTVCCLPNTNPPLDNEEMINYVRTIAARESPIRVFPIGCITIGRKGEELVDMNELEMAGVIAFS